MPSVSPLLTTSVRWKLTLAEFWSGIRRLIFTCHCSVSGQSSRWVVSLLLNAEKKQNSSAKKSSSSFVWRRFFFFIVSLESGGNETETRQKSSLLTSLRCLDSAFTSLSSKNNNNKKDACCFKELLAYEAAGLTLHSRAVVWMSDWSRKRKKKNISKPELQLTNSLSNFLRPLLFIPFPSRP